MKKYYSKLTWRGEQYLKNELKCVLKEKDYDNRMLDLYTRFINKIVISDEIKNYSLMVPAEKTRYGIEMPIFLIPQKHFHIMKVETHEAHVL